MNQLAVLMCITHIFFPSERRKNKDVYNAIEGTWLFDQMLKGAGGADPGSLPGNIVLNSSAHKKKGIGIWISKNRDEANFTWSISEKGSVLTLSPELSPAIQNQAVAGLTDYKGRYAIQSLEDTSFILQKEKLIIKFKRYIAE
ncbi:MAG: hypothetical protein ACO1O6_11180 [Bacteroidota bacterium]